ncbi:homocitrate synthase NifV [Anaerobacterium chartisolvens]|uniref:Homocitrate synthase NifV n=1 Tax=Anaerobacterium chartisolvens TaxID=1297424 RepID=A0A369AU25_9FIRM|nr:citramalate synthase [Anaerobacterium chartisolvens]RCX12721.1 homocitrate synthase NifV [Anaerobacterium chartisolvens]
MPLKINDSSSLTIIDRTLPEIYMSEVKMSRLDIIDLCWALKDIGVDLIEINRDICAKVGKLPAGIDFLLRVRKREDLHVLQKASIRSCIIGEEQMSDSKLMEELKSTGVSVSLEYRVDTVQELLMACKSGLDKGISRLRILGLSRISSFKWIEAIKEISTLYGGGVDICAENSLYCATALTVEGAMNGAGSVTASFSGYGGENGFAALEEVLASIKTIIDPYTRLDLKKLPNLKKKFTHITGRSVSGIKPVIGRDIFKYESGIHADGIGKNPLTYEPFDPAMVGQQRRLVIGKHSGKKSVMHKLKELGITLGLEELDVLLQIVKDRSVEMKRSLDDIEIIRICTAGGLEAWELKL